jgi:hypothetical protein
MRAPKTVLVATDFSRLAEVGVDVALIRPAGAVMSSAEKFTRAPWPIGSSCIISPRGTRELG